MFPAHWLICCKLPQNQDRPYCVSLFYLRYLKKHQILFSCISVPWSPSVSLLIAFHIHPLPSVHTACFFMKTTSSIELITWKLDIWCWRLLYLHAHRICKDIDWCSFKIIQSYNLCMEYNSSCPEEGNDPCKCLLHTKLLLIFSVIVYSVVGALLNASLLLFCRTDDYHAVWKDWQYKWKYLINKVLNKFLHWNRLDKNIL